MNKYFEAGENSVSPSRATERSVSPTKWKADRIRDKRRFIGSVILAIIAVPVLFGFMWILSIIFN